MEDVPIESAPQNNAMSGTETSGAQFSQDETGARVMRDEQDAQASFVRMRRWRKGILGLSVALVLIMTISFAASRNQNDTSPSPWQLVGGESLRVDENLNDFAGSTDTYTNFGGQVKVDLDANRLAVAKKGLNGAGGAVHVYSHLHPDTLVPHPNQWFLETVLQVPLPQSGSLAHDDIAMDMSESGNHIVFNQGNTIHIYLLDGSGRISWKPMGDPIVLPANHPLTSIYGSQIAMSGDGRYIAVLGYDSASISNAFVDIFHYQFNQMNGQILDEWDLVYTLDLQSNGPGGSLAFDTLGKRLVVGEPAQNDLGAKISSYVRVDDTPMQWAQEDDALHADPSLAITAVFDKVVSLSGDGKRLAYGSVDGQENAVGVLELRQDVQGPPYWFSLGHIASPATLPHQNFGASVAISMDGKRLAVGAPGTPDLDLKGDKKLEKYLHGQVYLYQYNEALQKWTEVAPPKTSAYPADGLGTSVSIEENGFTVAVGAPLRSPVQGQTTGAVEVFRINSY